jgi:hypothetical protein
MGHELHGQCKVCCRINVLKGLVSIDVVAQHHCGYTLLEEQIG